MYINNDRVCAEVGNYLKHRTQNIVALSVLLSDREQYEELQLNSPLDIEVEGNYIFFNNRSFLFLPPSLNKESIKAYIVRTRYTVDDQMAILLNKDDSEEDTIRHNKMQEWRVFASKITNKVLTNEEVVL